jgi:hypothetical protein
MKRTLSILIALLLFATTQAQIGRYPFARATATTVVDSASWEDEYKALYYELDITPGIDTANAQNTLVSKGLDHGWWDKSDILYVTAQRTESGALLNWIDPTGDDNITNTGSAAFVKYEGFTGNSAGSVNMTTNWNPSTEKVNYTLDSATLAAYTRIDINADEVILGAYQSANRYITLYPRSAGSLYARINSQISVYRNVSNSLGLSTAVRINTDSLRFYQNGVSLGDARPLVLTNIPSANLLIFSLASLSYSNNQVSFIMVGGKLSPAEIQSMYEDVEEYLDYIGAGVVD